MEPLADDRLAEVPGFLTPQAARLLDGLARRQSREGLSGDVAEIGVFYGRAALVLGRTLRDGERLVACDRFDVGAADVEGWSFHDPQGPEEALRRRWAEWIGTERSLVVRRGDSTALGPDDLGAPARLIHVDGGHDLATVAADLRLAAAAVHPQGAVVVDDVLLPEWPDVTVAVIDHLRAAGGRLLPVAVAEHKLVLCAAVAAPRYRAWAREELAGAFPAPGFLVVERGLDGHVVLVASRLPA